MTKLASRLARIAAAIAVITLLAFGAFQANATATSLSNCQAIPGPNIHCNTANECADEPECEGATTISCVEPQSGPPKCCMCII